MPDKEASEPRKRVERKKYSQVVNVLKESVRAKTITKHILELGIKMTIGEFRASVLVIEKIFIKIITKDEAIQF